MVNDWPFGQLLIFEIEQKTGEWFVDVVPKISGFLTISWKFWETKMFLSIVYWVCVRFLTLPIYLISINLPTDFFKKVKVWSHLLSLVKLIFVHFYHLIPFSSEIFVAKNEDAPRVWTTIWEIQTILKFIFPFHFISFLEIWRLFILFDIKLKLVIFNVIFGIAILKYWH